MKKLFCFSILSILMFICLGENWFKKAINLSNYLLVWGKDRCEPDFASDCFSAVNTDLAKVVYLIRGGANDIDDNYLENICNAIDDALNCTSDIIDVDCSEEEGRNKFDKWNMALLNTYYELCDAVGEEDKILLKALLMNFNCWNATHFLECLQTNAGVSSVSQMMAIDINKKECDVLYQSFEFCRLKQLEVTKELCTYNQTRDAVSLVHFLFDIFMDSSHCKQYYANGDQSHHIYYIQLIVLLILAYFQSFIPIN